MLFEKNFYSITAEDLKNLIAYKVSEDKTVEFKQELPGNSDSEIKEFLADVSSFANALGGMIYYGISEEEGVALTIDGVAVDDADKEILRLQNIISSSIKPRLTQLVIRIIEVDDKKVIIVRIPRSWSAPHVVDYKNRWRFYIRTSAGKHPMDIDEVREKMILSNSLSEKIHQFRDQRFDLINSGEYPIKLICDSQVVLHLIPFSSFYPSGNESINFNIVPENYYKIPPLYSGISYNRYNLEGYINFGSIREDGSCAGYVQIFRNGIFESVNSSMLCHPDYADNRCFIPSTLVEREIVEKLGRYFSYQKTMGVIPPIALFLSFLNIYGYFLAVKGNLDPFEEKKYNYNRENLLLPELIFEDYPDDIPSVMQTIFDILWNAFGWKRSYDYDEEGKWLG